MYNFYQALKEGDSPCQSIKSARLETSAAYCCNAMVTLLHGFIIGPAIAAFSKRNRVPATGLQLQNRLDVVIDAVGIQLANEH